MKMAEEGQKQKGGLVRLIFKWIGLGLLGLLIILGLIFQAPWKVITLLAVFLLAHTVLPRAGLKWFWAGVGVVVIALVIWVFLPEDDTGWRPYTFDEELAALEAKRAIPDEENAATIYNELLENPLLDGNEPEFFVRSSPSARSAPWPSKDHPEMAEWLEKQEAIIAALIEASKWEKCMFPIAVDTFGLSRAMGRRPLMRKWAILLVAAGNNDIAEGRIDEGLEKYIAVLRMGKHLCQQQEIIETMVAMAVNGLALKQVNRLAVAGAVKEEHLRLIDLVLADVKYDWGADFPRFLENEKLMQKNTICSFAYEKSPNGKTRLSRDPLAIMRAEFPDVIPPFSYWQKKLYKAATIVGWFGMPSTPQKAADMIDASFARYYEMGEPGFGWGREPQRLISILEEWNWRFMRYMRFNFRYFAEGMADMSEETFYMVHDAYLAAIARKRGSQIIVALRRYKNANGQWPESLDDVQHLVSADTLVDPIAGDLFVYMLTDENFTLYSKGKNNIDEGGEYDANYLDGKTSPDDRLIWPKRTRDCEAEEESADDEKE
ncbi:MAG: hypothetical protein JSW23_00880 [Planctomycetota bacterium]|nr:MAG: hypothetical protein JSW23_00880 [Planctomycetota bacterium]